MALPGSARWSRGFFEGRLILVGMPNTKKFQDLARDPRFSLHTATVDHAPRRR